jgi:hypothetical protein
MEAVLQRIEASVILPEVGEMKPDKKSKYTRRNPYTIDVKGYPEKIPGTDPTQEEGLMKKCCRIY